MLGRAPKRARGSSDGGETRGETSGYGVKPEPAGLVSASRPPMERLPGASEPQRHDPPAPSTRMPPTGKMLLPPISNSRTGYWSTLRNEKSRTSHACEICRKAKAKCSGGQPCDKCNDEGRECIYGEGKRDKDRKKMERLHHQNMRIVQRREHLITALKNFAIELGPSKRKELEELITSPNSIPDDDDEYDRGDERGSELPHLAGQGEYDVAAAIGSPGSLDVINEDTNRDEHTRAAGFMGKSSAVAWVQRAKRAAAHDREDERNFQRSAGMAANGSFTEAAYHAEPQDFLEVETDDVNPYEWPPPAVAKALVDSYFDHVHYAFPVLSKRDFYATFRLFPKRRIVATDHSWLSLVNLVFAIGAKHARTTAAEFCGDDRDHLVYYARARALGMDQRTINQDPELQHTCCLGVLGLYLLATDQLNSSWTICGIAIRNATALGLHVRSEAKDLSDTDKELRVRLWWSLYGLECLLDELTGRPSCISDRDVSTPLPINVDETTFRRNRNLYDELKDRTSSMQMGGTKSQPSKRQYPTPAGFSTASRVSSMRCSSPDRNSPYFMFVSPITPLPLTSSTYFIHRTQLCIILHEILAELYCAALVKARWSDVQDIIRLIDARLVRWKESLPRELDISPGRLGQNDHYAPQRTSLSIFYNSSRMTLFRPCLCRFEGLIVNESDRSKTFDLDAAISCVESARSVLAALPPIADPKKIYNITGWWNIVHCITGAASVLMLELAYQADHLPSRAEAILNDAKTAVLWLRALADQSIAARKAWEIFDNLFQQVAPKVGGETWSMPKSAPVPPGWKYNRFGRGPKTGDPMRQRQQEVDDSLREQQLFRPTSSAMVSWANHSSFSLQQGFSAPAPTGLNFNTTDGGVTPSYLTGAYIFNEIYGRFDEFGPPQAQSSSPYEHPGVHSYHNPIGTTSSGVGMVNSFPQPVNPSYSMAQEQGQGQFENADGIGGGEFVGQVTGVEGGGHVSHAVNNIIYGVTEYSDWAGSECQEQTFG